MLAFCADKKNNIYAVIAYKVDRISRNIADYSNIKVRLKRNNILIKSVSENFEDTPAGRFMENIIANVSQFDNEVRTERSVGGMKEAVQEGRYVWRAPLGYSNVRVGNKSNIEPNNLAPLVKEVFELISNGRYSTDIIRLMIKEKGLVGKNGNAINKAYFFRLVRNPIYKGLITSFGVPTIGSFEPIVSTDLFDNVQAILKGRKNKTKQYLKENPDFPLTRFISNADGRKLSGYWSKGKRLKYPYYSFRSPGTTIGKNVLEQQFVDLLNKYEFKTMHLNILKEQLQIHLGKRMEDEAYANAAVESRVQEINEQIDKLISLHTQGTLSANIFSTRVAKLEDNLTELQGIIKTQPQTPVNILDLLNFVERALTNPGELWAKSPIETRRKLQVFDFPYGLTYDGDNFRTPQLCSIYKLKEAIDSQMFSIVDLRFSETNTQYSSVLPPFSENVIQNKVFMEIVHTDLKKLHDIITFDLTNCDENTSLAK
jgi:site-specific DNA recombinase